MTKGKTPVCKDRTLYDPRYMGFWKRQNCRNSEETSSRQRTGTRDFWGSEATSRDLHWWIQGPILSRPRSAPPRREPGIVGTMTCRPGSSTVTCGPWEGRVTVGAGARGKSRQMACDFIMNLKPL